jgi:hypothetical protein
VAGSGANDMCATFPLFRADVTEARPGAPGLFGATHPPVARVGLWVNIG